MPRVRDALLFVALVAGSDAVYFHQHLFLDPARVLFALAALGFLFASPSDRPLRTWPWAVLVAIELWLAQTWASSHGAVRVVCTLLGAALAIRAGARGMARLLPEAENETGMALRAGIRRELVAAVALFVTACVWDGIRPGAPAVPRGLLLALSAAFFMRFLLLQSKHLGIAPARLGASDGLVRSQRWPILVLMSVLVATPFPSSWLGENVRGPLLVTSALMFVLAGLLFALAVAHVGWPKRDVRRTSFSGGIGLAFTLAAVVAEIQGATPESFGIFGALALAFLLVLPFARSTTKLFDRAPRLQFVVAPPFFSVMVAPVTAASGAWTASELRAALVALALFITTYYVVVTFREGRGVIYPFVSLVVVIAGSWVDVGGAWETFALSFCFVLYAVDLRARS